MADVHRKILDYAGIKTLKDYQDQKFKEIDELEDYINMLENYKREMTKIENERKKLKEKNPKNLKYALQSLSRDERYAADEAEPALHFAEILAKNVEDYTLPLGKIKSWTLKEGERKYQEKYDPHGIWNTSRFVQVKNRKSKIKKKKRSTK